MSNHTTPRAIVLAAGQGTRMKSARPKVLHDLAGWPLLAYPLAAVRGAGADRVAVVVGHQEHLIRAACEGSSPGFPPGVVEGLEWVLQDPPRGTGDAVAKCASWLAGSDGVVLVVNGDSPLIGAASLGLLVQSVEGGAAGAFLSAELDDPGRYGRVLRDVDGRLERIVEASEASPAELEIREINAGAYAFRWPVLAPLLVALRADNAKGEYFLTDAVRLLLAEGSRVEAIRSPDPEVALGVNTQAELARVGAVWQARLKDALMAAGVSIPMPEHVYVEQEVEVGPDTIVHPFTVLRRGTRIAAGCQVGPFAHLRGGVRLDEGAEIGNFVEAKAATLGARAKAKHLSYLGDVEIGERANVGAGTIVANYDGQKKHRTKIGPSAFIGSGTVLVAPVEVGERALTGAGAVVLSGRDVGPGEVVVGVPAKKIGTR